MEEEGLYPVGAGPQATASVSTLRRSLLGGAAACVGIASAAGCSSLPGLSRRSSSQVAGRGGGRRASVPGPEDAPESVVGRLDDASAREAAFFAVALVDTPYRYGGNTPEGGFDCSGLIVYVYREAAGFSLPRTVAQLVRAGNPVHYRSVRAGDLVVFDTVGRYSHAGIYVGGGRFVHAPSSGGVVRIEPIAGRYWRPRFSAVRRI